MQVFKFGGASVKDADAVKNVAKILERYQDERLLVVVSAMGKCTNLLESLCKAYFAKESFHDFLHAFKSYHRNIIKDLLAEHSEQYHEVENLFIELECLLEAEVEDRSYDQVYDQIVAFGELISSRIISQYLHVSGLSNRWLDARNFISTSGHHRRARVHWERTENLIGKQVGKLVNKQIVITQGFIGKSGENQTTTLGREGSDYSAAIFAYCLDASSVTIWKDVPGVLNADPKRFKDTQLLPDISFKEAIELAYYGASVIHPKTIQPLMRKKIPLFVKSFVDPNAAGTIVQDHDLNEVIQVPCYIYKDEQVLLSIATQDFSFIVEDHLSEIFEALARSGVQVNLMQNTAISFSVCVNNDVRRLDDLMDMLEGSFAIESQGPYQLLTIFNCSNDSDASEIVQERNVILEHKSGRTLQLLLEN